MGKGSQHAVGESSAGHDANATQQQAGEVQRQVGAAQAAPRLVAADIDGTFVYTNKQVPEPNLQLLDRLATMRIPFVPCTGRPVVAIPEALLAHPATRYAIGANGAVVYDVPAARTLHVDPLDPDRVLLLYDLVHALHATFDIFADGEVFAERIRYDAMGDYGIDEPSLEVLRQVRRPVDLTVPQIVARASSIEKVTCFWKDEVDREGIARALHEVGGFSVTQGHPKNFELQAEGVSKGSALAWLCSYLHIPATDVVAFGDESNDLPMLTFAGDGVAMANATEAVLAAANHVTLSNDEAGVAHYLRHL